MKVRYLLKMFNNVYKGKRVLVTGHTGFKGSWLSEWLVSLGAEVAGFSDQIPTKPSHFEVLQLEKRMHHNIGDIRDAGAVDRVVKSFRPHIIFHLAAQPLVRDSYDDPATTFSTNVMGTVNLLHSVYRTPGILAAINVTSDKCYENKEWEYGYRETERMGGKDPYSASKGCAELVFSSFYRSYFQGKPETKSGAANSVANIATVRAGNVIGGGDWAKDRIVPDAVRAWSKGQDLVIRSPDATRPWQHVIEPLSGYMWLAACLVDKPSICEGYDLIGEGFNFGPKLDSNRRVIDLLDEAKKYWKSASIKIDSDGTKGKKEAGLLNLTTERAKSRLQWHSVLDFNDTVRMTSEWYQRFYSDTSANGMSATAELTRLQIKQYAEKALSQNLPWAK